MDDLISTVGIEITDYCNLNCIHCFQGDKRQNINLSLDEITTILNKVIPYLPQYIVISGGEPFTHPCILDLLTKLGMNFPKTKFIIATNGTLLNEKIVSILEKNKNIAIQISLDGASREVHEKQHGFNTFERIIQSLKMIENLPYENKYIQMTISKINYKECIEVAELAKKNNCRIKYQYVCITGNAKQHSNILELTPAQQISTYLRLKRYSELNPDLNIIPPKSMLSCSFDKPNTPISLNINIRGDVSTCTCLDPYFYIGNIFNNKMNEIIHSDVIKMVSDRVKIRKSKLQKHECSNCIIKDKCEQGCIGRAIQLGNETGLDGECTFRRSLFDFNNTMSNYRLRIKKD